MGCELVSLKRVMEEEFSKCTIFKDAPKLEIHHTPLELPHRESEIRKLIQTFKFLVLNPGKSVKVVITGSTGTGKTVISKRFGAQITEKAKVKGINLQYIHVNCQKSHKPMMVYNQVIHQLNPNAPKRGFSSGDRLHYLSEGLLQGNDVYLLLCLDDADVLIKNYPEIIYNLTRLGEDASTSKQRLSLITVAKDNEFKKYLDASTLSSFQSGTIHLEKYSFPQLRDILQARIKAAFHDGAVQGESIDLISDFGAEVGDARYALELLWASGLKADEIESPIITPELVRQAKISLEPGDKKIVIWELDLYQKVCLLAIARQLKATEMAYFTFDLVQKRIQSLYQEFKIEQRDESENRLIVKEFIDSLRIVNVKAKPSEIRFNRLTPLRLNIPVAFEGELERWIEKNVEFSRGE